MIAQRPALWPAFATASVRACNNTANGADSQRLQPTAVGNSLFTESILAELVIPIHSPAVDFMHVAQLPQGPHGDDVRSD